MTESSVQSGQDDGGNGNNNSGNNGGNSSGNGGKGRRSGGPNVRRRNYTLVGSVVVGILVIALALGMTKPEWQQYLEWGFTTREVNVAGDYFTLPNSSKVKLGGVEVGRIDNVTRRADGTADYKVRVQSDVIDKVGSAPSANVRPTTLLGGIVYLDLLPGGDRTQKWEDPIPLDRTRLPVELSQVVQAIQPDAVKGIPATVNGLEGALTNGGIDGLKSLARQAPGALGPGAGVLNALTGNNPGTDLPNVVSGLQKTTAVLSRKDGQIDAILRDLHTTTTAFAQSSKPTVEAIRKLPVALDTARAGLFRLSGTLDNLKATAPVARPTVQQLDKLLQRIDPVLVHARPVVNDLRYAVHDLRPVVDGLVPAAKDLRYTFRTLDPSLDRLRGPVTATLEGGFNPTDDQAVGNGNFGPGTSMNPDPSPYTDTGRRHSGIAASENPAPKLRDELGPLFVGVSNTSGYYGSNGMPDSKGDATAFAIGFGPESLQGLPTDLGSVYQQILGLLAFNGAAGQGAALPTALPLPGAMKLPVPIQAPALPLPGAAPAAPGAAPAAGLPLPIGGTR